MSNEFLDYVGDEEGSRVMIGVVGDQTFSLGNGIQALVSGEKC